MNKRAHKAILFSGGLDSTCAAILDPSALLIRVSTGAVYDAQEQAQALRVAEALKRPLLELHGILNLAALEQPDALIPGRNALIALTAAVYAENIALVSVAGDGTHATDKCEVFAGIMSALIVQLFGSGSLTLPYRDLSKHALLAKALAADSLDCSRALPHVWSCYEEGPLHCGRCKACVRLWAALRVNGRCVPEMHYYPRLMPIEQYCAVFVGRGEEEDAALRLRLEVT